MLDRAIEYLPALRKLSSLRAWTGFRAATPDKFPLIGPHVEHKRLYLATGHEGLGITTSLGTAKLLVAQIVNRESLRFRSRLICPRGWHRRWCMPET